MAIQAKLRPTLGMQLWRVEWCSKLAFNECGDVDLDRCTMKSRAFSTKNEARAFAEKIWPSTHSTFGIVELDQIEFVPYDKDDVSRWPHVGYWTNCSAVEIFSGEWEC